MYKNLYIFVLIVISGVSLSGCATLRKADMVDELQLEITQLKKQLKEKDVQIEKLRAEKQKGVEKAEKVKQKELTDLERAKAELEERLKKEIGEYKARLEMTERGVVITFLAEIFFDSGKDVIRTEGESSLQKVAEVLNTSVADAYIAVEGHTDNEPIKYSGWKSNWELSSARALAVLHYFTDKCQLKPERLSAIGHGEYRLIASNDTPSGRQQNRRVEIVILPTNIKKIKK